MAKDRYVSSRSIQPPSVWMQHTSLSAFVWFMCTVKFKLRIYLFFFLLFYSSHHKKQSTLYVLCPCVLWPFMTGHKISMVEPWPSYNSTTMCVWELTLCMLACMVNECEQGFLYGLVGVLWSGTLPCVHQRLVDREFNEAMLGGLSSCSLLLPARISLVLVRN